MATGVVDVTALGDPVNVASRLQQHAYPGELVMGYDVFGEVRERDPATARIIELRGREDPVRRFTVACA